MGLYARFVLPRLLSAAMRQPDLVPFRSRVGHSASGRVLELGIGPALNLPFYGPDVTAVVGIDPSAQLLAMAERKRGDQPFDVQLFEGSAEALPLDTAASTPSSRLGRFAPSRTPPRSSPKRVAC